MAVFHNPDKRLASRVSLSPASSTAVGRDEAVKRAAENVGLLQDAAVADIDRNLELIQALLLEFKKSPEQSLHALYEASDSIHSTAALFDLEPLGVVAYMFCDFLSCISIESPKKRESISVYASTLMLMKNRPHRDELFEQMVQSLKQLNEHEATPASSSPE